MIGTYPGGKLCRYIHLSPPFGHVQNQPYFPSSTAEIKYLQTLSVVVFGFPCRLNTTFRSFSSSQSSILSFCNSSFRFASSSSRVSWYKSLFAPFLSTFRSCENLHFLPFSHWPFLKNWHSTVLGSTPNGTFCTCTGLNSSAASARAASDAAFSLALASFSASLRFSSGVLLDLAWAFSCSICRLAWPPFLFFIPNVLSSTDALAFLGAVRSFLGGIVVVLRRLDGVGGCEA